MCIRLLCVQKKKKKKKKKKTPLNIRVAGCRTLIVTNYYTGGNEDGYRARLSGPCDRWPRFSLFLCGEL